MRKTPLLIVLMLIAISVQAQEKVSSQEIIDRFLEAIGGKDQLLSLQTRVEKTSITKYGIPENSLNNANKVMAQTTYYQSPDNYLEHSFSTKGNYHNETILFKRQTCSWFYRSNGQSIFFFDPEPIKFDKHYPRTYLLEPFNLKPEKYVVEEEGMYRVDFKDHRQDGGIQSVYIDKESFLLLKRTYVTKSTMTRWTFVYENYQTVSGFSEPRTINLYGGGELFMAMEIEYISYNEKFNPTLFDSPVPCLPGESIPLNAPYYLPKAIVDN